MKKAIIIFCIVMIAVVVLTQALGDRDVFAELFPSTATDADLIKAEAINTNHLVSNESTLAGNTWIGSGGKIGYMGNDDRYSWTGVVVQAYINENGSLVLQTLGGETIIFGGNPNDS